MRQSVVAWPARREEYCDAPRFSTLIVALLWAAPRCSSPAACSIATTYDVYVSISSFITTPPRKAGRGCARLPDLFFRIHPWHWRATHRPIHVSSDFRIYRARSSLAFFLLEVGVVLIALRVGRTTLQLGARELVVFLIAYSALGLLQAIFCTIASIWRLRWHCSWPSAAFATTSRNSGTVLTWLAWNGGFLIKIMPQSGPYTALLRESRMSPRARWAMSHERQCVRRSLTIGCRAPGVRVLVARSHLELSATMASARSRSNPPGPRYCSGAHEAIAGYTPEVVTRWRRAAHRPESIPTLVDFLSRYLGWILWLVHSAGSLSA